MSLQNSSYRVLQDDEDKWLTEIQVDPIFMEHTDKITVKVVKYSLQISCEVFETLGEGRLAKTQRKFYSPWVCMMTNKYLIKA